MCKPTFQQLMQDSLYTKHVPVLIQIPARAVIEIEEDTTKRIVEATLDDRVFAAHSAIDKRRAAIRERDAEACVKGAPGTETLVDALSRQGGAQ